eukprot:scaffold39413_cov33-Phaeocystis_antarctica.AAC.1
MCTDGGYLAAPCTWLARSRASVSAPLKWRRPSVHRRSATNCAPSAHCEAATARTHSAQAAAGGAGRPL